ncbi:hypothetical protein CALVIDRAFT_556324 [Calocera viscosa TUFC12733]|uniref:Uncharacterized protein n=1 Tax=Calocera viscosa (strain TUFC12733) TaxID=1330018 RepID=A0A167KE74_CALVF|nr:hypothetical protein CALVIDRAFT_556324 [Calocera viscosa TUFC12733]
MSYSRIPSSSTEALLPQKPQKDYFSTVASMQGSIGITGQTPLPPQPKPVSEKTHFWSRKDKSEAPPQRKENKPQPQRQPKQPGGIPQMSREEALALLMDKYGMASIQLGARSGRM